MLRGDFFICELGVGGDYVVVGYYVDVGQGYQDDFGGIGCVQDMVDNSDDQLEDIVDGQIGSEDDMVFVLVDDD